MVPKCEWGKSRQVERTHRSDGSPASPICPHHRNLPGCKKESDTLHTRSIDVRRTNLLEAGWIGAWREAWSFACLASDLHTHSLNLTQTCSDSPCPIQILSVSLSFIQLHSHSSFTQVRSTSCRLTQICSASCSFLRIRSESRYFNQSHSDSLSFAQLQANTSSCARIHSNSDKIIVSPPPPD